MDIKASDIDGLPCDGLMAALTGRSQPLPKLQPVASARYFYYQNPILRRNRHLIPLHTVERFDTRAASATNEDQQDQHQDARLREYDAADLTAYNGAVVDAQQHDDTRNGAGYPLRISYNIPNIYAQPSASPGANQDLSQRAIGWTPYGRGPALAIESSTPENHATVSHPDVRSPIPNALNFAVSQPVTMGPARHTPTQEQLAEMHHLWQQQQLLRERQKRYQQQQQQQQQLTERQELYQQQHHSTELSYTYEELLTGSPHRQQQDNTYRGTVDTGRFEGPYHAQISHQDNTSACHRPVYVGNTLGPESRHISPGRAVETGRLGIPHHVRTNHQGHTGTHRGAVYTGDSPFGAEAMCIFTGRAVDTDRLQIPHRVQTHHQGHTGTHRGAVYIGNSPFGPEARRISGLPPLPSHHHAAQRHTAAGEGNSRRHAQTHQQDRASTHRGPSGDNIFGPEAMRLRGLPDFVPSHRQRDQRHSAALDGDERFHPYARPATRE